MSRIIVEDKFGHEIQTSSWIDSAGTIRLVIQNFCPQCDHINITEEAENLAKQMLLDMGITRASMTIIETEDDPVEDILN